MEQFRFKTPEELQEQINATNETLDTSIVQESVSSKIFNLSLEEIKTKYPERYNVYLKILRAQKNNQEIDLRELHEINTWISALNNLDTYITEHNNIRENLDKRSVKQLDVFEDIRDSLEEGKKEGYIKLPTGVGKTVLFSKITEALGLKTLIVVPSKILVKQTGEKLERFTDIEFGKFYQEEKDLSKNVTIITYNSLIAGIKNGTIDKSHYDALILDEAHKALGEETVKTIDKFSGIKIGFTATPKYSRRKHVSDLLEHEIHRMDILEAVREGFISRFKSYIAYTDIDLSGVEVKNGEMYDENQLEKAINKKSRNKSAVELYKIKFEGQLAVVYCGGVNHAIDVAKEFKEAGISAEVISGNTPDDDGYDSKKAILERFNNGETKVLCNARILIEGFDEPKMSVCLNLHPTLSLVDAEQRAGRALRLDPDNSEKWAYIVDFIDRNPIVPPLTFAAIAEASEASEGSEVSVRENKSDKDNKGNESKEKVPDVNIVGLKVVTDAQEVLSVSMGFEDDRDVEKKDFLSFKLLKEEIKNAGISSFNKYRKARLHNPKWPSKPYDIYKDSGWVSWLDLFGKEKKEFISFENLREEVQKEGVSSISEYREARKKYPNWNTTPHKLYKDSGWKSWIDLFAKEQKDFLPFSTLKYQVREKGISSISEYKKTQKNNQNWPSNPNRTYKNSGWVSWLDLFGREQVEFPSFENLREEVQKEGVSSILEYQKTKENHPNWPSNPDKLYKDSGWVSWLDLFGKEKKEFPYLQDLKEEVKNFDISSVGEYKKARADHVNWPSDPDKTYKDWISWFDLFGK